MCNHYLDSRIIRPVILYRSLGDLDHDQVSDHQSNDPEGRTVAPLLAVAAVPSS